MPLWLTTTGAMLRAERQAVNAYVQGFAANITKLAMRQLHVQLAEFLRRYSLRSTTRSFSGYRKSLDEVTRPR